MKIKTQRLLARAKKIAKKGEHEEARKLYTTILEASPDNQEAKNGLLSLQQGKDQLSPPKAEIQSVFALLHSHPSLRFFLHELKVVEFLLSFKVIVL